MSAAWGIHRVSGIAQELTWDLGAQKYKDVGVSGPQRTPSMRPQHPPLRGSLLQSQVPVSDFVADTREVVRAGEEAGAGNRGFYPQICH